jgi:exopolysaccharide biosynthesis polyprenyl glycosylphosphotransferase
MNHKTQGYSILHRLALLIICISWFWALFAIWGPLKNELLPTSNPPIYSMMAVLGMLVSNIASFNRYHTYLEMGRWERLTRSITLANVQGVMVAFAMLLTYFLVKDIEISRAFLSTYILSLWTILVPTNYYIPDLLQWLFKENIGSRQTLLIGTTRTLSSIKEWVHHNTKTGFNITSIYTPGGGAQEHLNLQELIPVDNLEKYLDREKIFRVVIVPGPTSEYWIQGVIDLCQRCGCRIFIHNPYANYFSVPLVPVLERGQPFFSLQNEPLESPFNQILKRLFDLAVCLPIIVFVLPILTILVWLFQQIQSPGPIFFKQTRGGKGGDPFTILKFRSMHPQAAKGDIRQASKDDDRTFAFGRFIRKYSIDEFPQFLNVLFGDMSLVGPRPYMIEHDDLIGRDFRAYHVRKFVKPGVTGPAQCAGLRGEVISQDLLQARNEMDFNYVGNWSLLLDIEIVVKTALQVIFPPKSAY